MKNNSLAMLATISIVLGLASLVGYIDPAVCTVEQSEAFVSCEQAASQHILGFLGFTIFGAGTLLAGYLRSKRKTSARS